MYTDGRGFWSEDRRANWRWEMGVSGSITAGGTDSGDIGEDQIMRILKINNFLMLGASGVSLLLAAVLLGTGQLPFSGLFLGVSVYSSFSLG